MKPFMEERLIWFTYHNDKPIAMFANIPDLNQWFKFLNGKFGILQKLKFLWMVKTKKIKNLRVLYLESSPNTREWGLMHL